MRTMPHPPIDEVTRCLEDIRRFDRSRFKFADLGSDGSGQSFELSFSNLAHAVLRDKAPSLLDHEIGFQLLDRKDDNTKAVGVFGFKVGSHTLYVPVFFLEGDLKGHELLYIKEQDLFVPLSEGWLNYLLNRKPNILGDSVNRNTAQLGVLRPDLNRLARSPWKYGSAMPPWAREVFPKFAHTALTDISAELDTHRAEINLPRFCKESASLDQLQWLVQTCRRYPKIARAVVEHHGSLDFISEAVKRAGFRATSASVLGEPPAPSRSRIPPIIGCSVLDPPPEHPIKRGALEVLTYDSTQQTKLPEGLDEEDAERLLRDRMLIKDRRNGDEVSVPYNVRVEQKLSNPRETGVYEVLVKPGTFERCFVAFQPQGPNGRVEFCTIVRLDEGQRNWLNVHPSHVWCASRIEGKEYDTWFDGLRDPDSLPQDKKRYMLIGPRGNATLPFQVENTLGDTEGDPSYAVDFSDHADHRYSGNILYPSHRGDSYSSITESWQSPASRYDKYMDGQRIHLDSKEGTRIRSSMGDVWIPKGYKLLNLKPSEYDKARADAKANDEPVPCGANDQGRSEPPAIRPGSLLDAELGIVTKMATVEMRAVSSGIRIGERIRSPQDTLIHLVMDHGLAEGPSRQIVKNAQALKGRPYVFYIKYAQPFQGDPYLTSGAPTAPGFPEPNMGGENIMGWPGQTMGESEFMLPVDMGPTDNRGLYDIRPEAVGEPMDAAAQNAAGSGQQEVFDTAMIGTMLKAVRDDTMIDRYLPDLVKGLDRLGRILFHFYWNGDQFADRFGRQDMPELEDTLRDTFELMGDTVLFLKQKTIEPYPEEDAADLELSR